MRYTLSSPAHEHGGTSATRRFGGLGLGLCLSRAIVEEHQGTLAASSPGPGSGATFTVLMPTVPLSIGRRRNALDRPGRFRGREGARSPESC